MKKILVINCGIVLLGMLLSASTCTPDLDPNGDYPAAALEISGMDLGTQAINSPGKVVNLEVKNTGSMAIGIDRVFLNHPLSFQGGSYPGTSGNCAKTIAPGVSCNLAIEIGSVYFRGAFHQSVLISYSAGNNIYSKYVDVRADFKDVAKLQTANIDFATVNVGSSKTEKMRLRNASIFETIRNLTIKQSIGSQFTIINPLTCATIAPSATCELDVRFTPLGAANINENIDISYESQGKKLSDKLNIKAIGQDVQHIAWNGQNFLTPTPYNTQGTITLNLTRYFLNMVDVNTLAVDAIGLNAAGLTVAPSPASTCGTATLGFGSNCTFVLKTTTGIKADTVINQNLKITYRVGGIVKDQTITLNGTFQALLPTLAAGSGHNLGAGVVQLANGESKEITIRVENPSSSGIAANNFKLAGKKSSTIRPLTIVPLKTTCGAGNLAAGSACDFVVAINPGVVVGPKNLNAALRIKYKIGGDSLTIPVTVTGNLYVNVVGFVPDFLSVTGHDFAPVNINPGDTFDVFLTFKNSSAGNGAKDFALKRYDPTGSTIMNPWNYGGAPYFIQVNQARSSCMAGVPSPVLAPAANCDIVLQVKPNPGTNSIDRKFSITYKDDLNNVHAQNFNIKGNWTFVGATAPTGPAVPPAPAWAENKNAPLIIPANNQTVEYFSYVKRPVKTNPLSAVLLAMFPQWAWSKIPGSTVNKVNHMVWTFESPVWGDKVKLKDIVPDRIVDPTTGKSYVLMYHGSTSDTIAGIFDQGSDKISFSAAKVTAYGMGFYLASNANESKNYACDRRNGKPVGIQPILLIVGVQEDDAIQGKRSSSDLGDNNGNPLNPNIYFRRTTTGHNQFVFYSNAKPYLRIFKIIRLGTGHGMANGYTDGDGFPIGNTTPDFDNNYKCNY